MGNSIPRRLAHLTAAGLIAFTAGAAFGPSSAAAAVVSANDVADPDSYQCGQSGFITFETLSDQTSLEASAINGVQFTTTGGFTWLVGDFTTGAYNGKFPAGGGYTSQGTHWAWLGPSQGAGRIDFVNGPTSYFSLLVSDNQTPVVLDAYRADGTLLETAGPASLNFGTGHMTELKVARGQPDIAYVIVHDDGNFFLIDAVCTNAPGVPRYPVVDYKQSKNAAGQPEPWAGARLYDRSSCSTMAAEGCAITAVTDVVASYGLSKLPDGTKVDPGTVNHFLGQRSATFSGCDIFWTNAAKALGYQLERNDRAGTPLATRIAHIDQALADGNLAIIGIDPPGVSSNHYVVVYEKAAQPAADGSPDYRIADPASVTRSGKTLSEAYGTTINQQAGHLQVVVIKDAAAQPGRSWVIAAHSPVELRVTDPNGAQTGYDPATGQPATGIPDSSYGLQEGLADDENGALPPEPPLLTFEQTQLQVGTYKVEVIGTGTGPYELDFAFSGGPDDNIFQTFAGTAAPGRTDTYAVVVSADGSIDVRLDTGDPMQLPRTGDRLTVVLAVGAGLLALGGILVGLTRRRRRAA